MVFATCGHCKSAVGEPADAGDVRGVTAVRKVWRGRHDAWMREQLDLHVGEGVVSINSQEVQTLRATKAPGVACMYASASGLSARKLLTSGLPSPWARACPQWHVCHMLCSARTRAGTKSHLAKVIAGEHAASIWCTVNCVDIGAV